MASIANKKAYNSSDSMSNAVGTSGSSAALPAFSTASCQKRAFTIAASRTPAEASCFSRTLFWKIGSRY